jgi:hypothetical protein
MGVKNHIDEDEIIVIKKYSEDLVERDEIKIPINNPKLVIINGVNFC